MVPRAAEVLIFFYPSFSDVDLQPDDGVGS